MFPKMNYPFDIPVRGQLARVILNTHGTDDLEGRVFPVTGFSISWEYSPVMVVSLAGDREEKILLTSLVDKWELLPLLPEQPC